MAQRRVLQTAKDLDGDITALCNDEAAWSPRRKFLAIADIESGLHTYYLEAEGTRIDVRVVFGVWEKRLEADPAANSQHNLSNLPDCPSV